MIYIDCNYSNINTNRIKCLIEYILFFFDKVDKEVSVIFVSNDKIRELNSNYRNVNSPTDVLTFALLEGEDMFDDIILGDIVISYDTALKQAAELNHPLNVEIDHLVCHGMLHLLGYDHINQDDRKKMFTLHENILKEFYKKNNELDYINDKWLLFD